MQGNRDARFSGLSEAIDKYMRGHSLVVAGRQSMVGAVWPEVVGEWYARHTQVLRSEGGVVLVWCDSAARAQQLQLDSAQIVAKLNERLGPRAVKEIRPSSGGIRRLEGAPGDLAEAPGPAPGDIKRMELTDEERECVDALSAGLADAALRRAFARVLGKELLVARWKREHGYGPCPAGCGALVPPGSGACMGCDPGRVPMQGSSDVLPDRWSGGEATW
jgi:predicted nucleic acid-binding Zn ribbon protein